MKKIKVVLAIRSLNIGGAERQFLEIAKHLDTEQFDATFLTMYPGTLDREIKCNQFICFNKSKRWDFLFIFRLLRFIFNNRPALVYTFMPDMNVIFSIVKFLSPRRFLLVWGQFGSEPDFSKYQVIRKQVTLFQRWIRFTTDALICDGSMGLDFYKKYKIIIPQSKVIYSGTDINRFKRDPEKRAAFRRNKNLQENHIAVGICSRLDPMKGYELLAHAARQILIKHSNVYFFSIGYGDDSIISNVNDILAAYSTRFEFLGKQLNPEDIMSGWDLYCSPSLYGEGFSNAIIEAMSCSLPVIATDVGEAKVQIEKAGILIPPGDIARLTQALDIMITGHHYATYGEVPRQRVLEYFNSAYMTRQTELFITSILK